MDERKHARLLTYEQKEEKNNSNMSETMWKESHAIYTERGREIYITIELLSSSHYLHAVNVSIYAIFQMNFKLATSKQCEYCVTYV